MIYVALPPEDGKWVVRASVHLKEISALINKLGGRIAVIAILALLAGIIAAIIYDLFEVKRLEKIKKDFVANVSHELRTPLTAIKGYAETLENEIKNPESKRYLEIIVKNTERLINIVTDLLTLSRLEEKQKTMTFEDVDIGGTMKNTVKIFEQQAAAKKLGITLEVPDDLAAVSGDALKIEQVFVNLIDNAIKYTETGGVTIRAGNENGAVKIEISDTGIGIPPEHIERIFERFYVVDKSRSRKAGGTGLGLSIVKHIMKLHGGTVTVQSAPAAGTKFTLYFRAKNA
jgi:two-component system phosphate regulon sensor histidine kinase PhoR